MLLPYILVSVGISPQAVCIFGNGWRKCVVVTQAKVVLFDSFGHCPKYSEIMAGQVSAVIILI